MVLQLKKEVAISTREWKQKESSDIRLSGYLRTICYQSGYGKMDKQSQINTVISVWNEKLESIQDRKKNHVGVRRYVLTPTIKEINQITDFKFTKYGDDSKEYLKKNGEAAFLNEKEKINKFFDDTIRDVMTKFKDRYVPKSDKIGYSFSIHHDTTVPHAHIYLLPYTEKKQYLSMNAGKYLRGKGMSDSKAVFNKTQRAESKLDYLKKSVSNSVAKVLKNYEKIKINGSGNEKKINAQKIKEKISKGLDQGQGLSLRLKP